MIATQRTLTQLEKGTTASAISVFGMLVCSLRLSSSTSRAGGTLTDSLRKQFQASLTTMALLPTLTASLVSSLTTCRTLCKQTFCLNNCAMQISCCNSFETLCTGPGSCAYTQEAIWYVSKRNCCAKPDTFVHQRVATSHRHWQSIGREMTCKNLRKKVS